MRRLLAFAAAAEALTGLGLLIVPSVVVKLLLNAEIVGAGVVAARVAGIALLSLGVACWPRGNPEAALIAMLGYNLLVAAYLMLIGLQGEMVGVLLWPVAVYHAAVIAPLSIALRTLRLRSPHSL